MIHKTRPPHVKNMCCPNVSFTIKTFDFFEYMQVLCTFGINMLIFFEYMQVW